MTSTERPTSGSPSSISTAVTETGEAAPVRIAYGSAPSQFGELTMPAGGAGNELPPVVVLLHGGFWRAQYDLTLMDALRDDLVARGYAVWNIEYRRVGEAGGGWPGTLDDVAAAIDLLPTLEEGQRVDVTRAALIGHSAGGHLALWAASRGLLPAGAHGVGPAVLPRVAIGLGPVSDLRAADSAGLGGGAVTDFLGGSAESHPARYDNATPAAQTGARTIVVRGELDLIVPAEFTVPPGGEGVVETIDVPGEDHFDLIDPESESWAAVIAALAESLGPLEPGSPPAT